MRCFLIYIILIFNNFQIYSQDNEFNWKSQDYEVKVRFNKNGCLSNKPITIVYVVIGKVTNTPLFFNFKIDYFNCEGKLCCQGFGLPISSEQIQSDASNISREDENNIDIFFFCIYFNNFY